MNKKLTTAIACSMVLAACSGGGGDSAPAPISNAVTVSYYGHPLPQAGASQAATKALVVRTAFAASDAPASAPPASDSNAASVKTLTDLLAAQGVKAEVQSMSASSLHALVMGEDGGKAPTEDQFAADPSGWAIANFQLDDMVTPMDDPAQQAALAQFRQDLIVFVNRMHVVGKMTFIIAPLITCDADFGHTASDGLSQTETSILAQTSATLAGTLPVSIVTDPATMKQYNELTAGHLGADCRTPDQSLVDQYTDSIVTPIAKALKEGFPGHPGISS